MTAMTWEADELHELGRLSENAPIVISATELASERDQTVQLAVAKAMEAVDARFTEAGLDRKTIESLITEAVAGYASEVAALKGVNAELRDAIRELERRPAVQVNVPATQQHFDITTPAVRGGDVIVKPADSVSPPAWWRQPKETITEVLENDREGMPTKTRAVHSY